MSRNSVYLVSVDVGQSEFANFCRATAVDHLPPIDQPLDEPRTRIFSLDKSGSQNHENKYDLLVGQWPKVFHSEQEIVDTLIDAIKDSLENDKLLSLIFVGSKPETLVKSKVFQLLADQLAPEYLQDQRIWTIGVVLTGPTYQKQSFQELLQNGGFDWKTIFCLGAPSTATASFSASAKSQMRVILDAACQDGDNDDSAWKWLHPSSNVSIAAQAIGTANDTAARLIYFATPKSIDCSESNRALAGIARTFENLTKKSQESDEKNVEAVTKSILEIVAPSNGAKDAELEYDDETIRTPPSADTNFAVQKKCNDILRKFKGEFEAFSQGLHQTVTSNIVQFLDDQDNLDKPTQEKISGNRIPIPAGGMMKRGRNKVEVAIATLEKKSEEWEEYAAQLRSNKKNQTVGLLDNSSHRGRKKSVSRGNLSREKPVRDAYEIAGYNVKTLPTRLILTLSTALIPAGLLLSNLVLHGWLKDDMENWFSLLKNLGPMEWGSLIAIVFILPVVITLYSLGAFRKQQRLRVSDVNNSAVEFQKGLVEMVSEARDYSLKTRSARMLSNYVSKTDDLLKNNLGESLRRQQIELFEQIGGLDLGSDDTLAKPISFETEADFHGAFAALIQSILTENRDTGKWNLFKRPPKSVPTGIKIMTGAIEEKKTVAVPTLLSKNAQEVHLVPLVWKVNSRTARK